jgi:hypothetical protein
LKISEYLFDGGWTEYDPILNKIPRILPIAPLSVSACQLRFGNQNRKVSVHFLFARPPSAKGG